MEDLSVRVLKLSDQVEEVKSDMADMCDEVQNIHYDLSTKMEKIIEMITRVHRFCFNGLFP